MSLPFVREVANLERYSLARANAGLYSNVIVGPRLQMQPLEGKTPPLPHDFNEWVQLLAGPLTWLIQQHSILSVVVGDHLSPHPKFLRMPSVDLNKVVRVKTVPCPADVSQVLAEEHRVMFDYLNVEVPLWGITVVQVQEDNSFYLLYNFQHAIGDGRSAMALTEQLVEQLNVHAALHGTDKPLLPTIVTSPTHELARNLEARVNCKPSYTTLIKEATMGLLLPGFLKKMIEPKYWAGEIDATLEAPHETEVDIWFLTQDETSLVAKAAKARNTTVQAILFAASIFATKAVYLSKVDKESDTKTTTEDKLSFGTPVAMRALIQPSIARNDQGSYVSEILIKNIRVRLDTEFWALAQSYRKQIMKKTATDKGVRSLLEHTGLLDFLPRDGWEDWMKGHVKKEQHGRESTLKLSNIGKAWDQTATEAAPIAFKILDAVFSQDACTFSSPFTLNAATANGVLAMTSSWQRATFKSKKSAQRFMTDFKRILLESSEPERKEYHFRDALVGL